MATKVAHNSRLIKKNARFALLRAQELGDIIGHNAAVTNVHITFDAVPPAVDGCDLSLSVRLICPGHNSIHRARFGMRAIMPAYLRHNIGHERRCLPKPNIETRSK